jgi:hypothetical protein
MPDNIQYHSITIKLPKTIMLRKLTGKYVKSIELYLKVAYSSFSLVKKKLAIFAED